MPSKTALIFGTRPEIIKLSPVVRELVRKRKDFFLLHTGQHHSWAMDRRFFKELALPAPRYRLRVHYEPARGHGEHTGRMLDAIETILVKERPRHVLVQGDTNSVLAGALVASKIPGMMLGHVEAGLRSYDRAMPEEINRIVADHLSNLCFAPTSMAVRTLRGEGIASSKIVLTGNTIVDALRENVHLAERSRARLPYGLKDGGRFILMTLHRQENVDDRASLTRILEGVRRVAVDTGWPVVFSAHPRTVNRLRQFGLKLPKDVNAHTPCGFMDFLRLESRAELILTDSGGVQEEACILGVPCVTLRTTTERPETVAVKANRIAGHDPAAVLSAARALLSRPRRWKNPFGDGRAAQRILKALDRC